MNLPNYLKIYTLSQKQSPNLVSKYKTNNVFTINPKDQHAKNSVKFKDKNFQVESLSSNDMGQKKSPSMCEAIIQSY